MSAAVERRHWHFTGSVQGVGFRYRAQYAAQLLDLTGWVENEDDGSVTLEVQGDPVKFRKLFALIQRSDYIQITAIRQKDIRYLPKVYSIGRYRNE